MKYSENIHMLNPFLIISFLNYIPHVEIIIVQHILAEAEMQYTQQRIFSNTAHRRELGRRKMPKESSL